MGENYFFVYGKELEGVAWGEVYPKNIDVDGVNADRYEIGVDLGDGESWGDVRFLTK